MKTFSISEAIKVGWDKVWQNIGLVLLVVIVNFAVSMVFGYVAEVVEKNSETLAFAIGVMSIIVSIIMSIGITKIYFKIHDGIPTSVNELFSHTRLFWKYVGVSILMMILVGLGLVLLIIPGIYLALRFAFASFLVVDKEVGPIEALKESGELTKGIKGQLILFGLALVGVNILGFLALGVGLLVTTPLSAIASIHVYRTVFASRNTAPVSESQPVIIA